MDITPASRTQLNKLMEARRLDLGITWRDLARSAGVSYEALRGLRRGPGGIAELTARRLDKALQWEPGSIAAVISGDQHDPVPLTAEAGALPEIVGKAQHDPVIGIYVRKLWALDIPEAQRLTLIEDLAAIRDKYRNGPGSGAPAVSRI